jgi:hypothetical protein
MNATHNTSLHMELIQRNTAVYVLLVVWVRVENDRREEEKVAWLQRFRVLTFCFLFFCHNLLIQSKLEFIVSDSFADNP